MKNLVLASLLGTLAGAAAVPSLVGPVHYQVTRPFSLYATVPGNANSGSVTLGQVPLDFILTDVLFRAPGGGLEGTVTVNGAPVLSVPVGVVDQGYPFLPPVHMTSSIFVPAGSTLGFVWWIYPVGGLSGSVTVAGYVQ